MRETRLKSFSCRNFRSFPSLEIGFPDRGFVLLESRNLETGGSSGAGKSSLLLGVSAALRYAPFPMTELQSWYTDEPAQVEACLSTADGEMSSKAGAKNSLSVGSQRLSAAKPIADRMKEAIGLGPDLLQALTYAPQDDGDDFLSLPSAKKYEFLSSLLPGMSDVEKAAKAAASAAEALRQSTVLKAAEATAAEEILGIARARTREADGKAAQAAAKARESQGAGEKKVAYEAAKKACQEIEARIAHAEADADQVLDCVARQHEPRIVELQAKEEALDAAMLKEQERPPDEDAAAAGRIQAMLEQGRKAKETAQARDRDREAAFRLKAQELDSRIGALKALPRQLKAIEDQRARHMAEALKLADKVCPTCERQWAEADGAFLELDAKIMQEGEIAIRMSQELEGLPALSAERQAMVFSPDPLLEKIDAGIQKLKDDLSKLKADAKKRRDDGLMARYKELDAARKELALAKTARDEELRETEDKCRLETKGLFASSASAKALMEAAWKALAKEEAEADAAKLAERMRAEEAAGAASMERQAGARAAAATEALIKARASRDAELDFARLVGREGFLGAIFEEVLAEIAGEANDCMRRIANVAHVTLDFLPDLGEGKGIQSIVRARGHEVAYRSGLSGGQKSSVRLAVRLAIRRVASRRAGCKPAWLLLDECFNGIDPVSKESCLEVLQEEAKDSLVIVVDHGSEFKALFERVISVEFKDGVSSLASRAA